MKKMLISTLCLTATGTMLPISKAEATEDNSQKQINENQVTTTVSTRSVTQEKKVNVGNSVNLNVRNQPSTSGGIIGKLKDGQVVKVISEKTNWSQIEYGGQIAYVHSDYLVNSKDEGGSNLQQGTSGDVEVKKVVDVGVGLNLNFRQSPSTGSSVLGKIKHGTSVVVQSTTNGWSKITYNGKVGYVASQYLKQGISSNSDSSNQQNSSTSATLTNMKVESSVGLNFRKSPSMQSQIISTLKNGTIVGVEAITDGWAKVYINNQVGYVSAQYLVNYLDSSQSGSGSSEKPNQQTFTQKVVNTDRLNMRSGPSTSTTVLTVLTKGTSVNVESIAYGWAKIHAQGKVGYVAEDYLSDSLQQEESQNTSDVFELISYAKSLIGKPYVFGTSGPNSFDCSGFIYHVFNKSGYNISRTSTSGYWSAVKKIDIPVVGDLVFFKDTYITGPSHMGIYLGNGDFIHAVEGVGVTISNINNGSYYKKHLLGYGRM